MSAIDAIFAPGARVVVRDAEWIVRRVDNTSTGGQALEEGWEIDRENVHSFRMKKMKPQGQIFEHRVWCLLAQLGFEYMNKDEKLKIPHSKNPDVSPKQIDVFAVDQESVLIVECKSDEIKKKTFQKDIADIKDIKKGICNNVRKHFSPIFFA